MVELAVSNRWSGRALSLTLKKAFGSEEKQSQNVKSYCPKLLVERNLYPKARRPADTLDFS